MAKVFTNSMPKKQKGKWISGEIKRRVKTIASDTAVLIGSGLYTTPFSADSKRNGLFGVEPIVKKKGNFWEENIEANPPLTAKE